MNDAERRILYMAILEFSQYDDKYPDSEMAAIVAAKARETMRKVEDLVYRSSEEDSELYTGNAKLSPQRRAT